ncbi:MAG: SDR family oxidoreductase, partial [Deltaproteobacteria bacterium]|nr:SDR family oxidoreductase [Deltaproteobacteria bacterium]
IVGLASAPLVAYSPAKSAVIMLTKILATEWGRFNVRVNAIAPGYTLTPPLKGMIKRCERNPEMILKRTPRGKMVKPDDIASAALFLASDKARYITGVTLPVDAGFLAGGVWSVYGG